MDPNLGHEIEIQVQERDIEGDQETVVQVPGINTFMRLPTYMRDANQGLFEPRVVAIGPYHHANNSTRDMEAHKERFRYGFFQRLGINVNRRDITAQCTEGALRCYSGNVGMYTTEDLMRDGCFIIELLIQWNDQGRSAHVDNHMRLMSNSIYYDLLLVDNQVPFFMLNRIYGEYKRRANGNPAKLVDLITIFFNHEGQFSWANNLEQLCLSNAVQVRHLLDLQYNLIISNNMETEPTLNNCPLSMCGNICHSMSSMPRAIPGANELQDYGVKFCANKNQQRKIFDVTFECKTISIPRFEINFGSKILLANFFAHDQITHQPGIQIKGQPGNSVGPVTSYVVLMNSLINTKEDVMVLQRKGILDNLLSNEEEVANFFNKLGRCALVDVREHRYTSMFNDINKYWKSTLNICKYLVIFRTKHFRNPWTGLSLAGALMVLVFSCTSMIIAILNYRGRKH
uniref:Uncharacterized protein n=1 Tax=Oryza punctata TaxID=4537 RepID=A0A0E0MMX7_ORYPU